RAAPRPAPVASPVLGSCPPPAAPNRYGPPVPARNAARNVITPLSPQPTPGGSPSHQASAVAVRCSLANTAPAAVLNSRRMPGAPVTGSAPEPGAGPGP